MSNVSRVNFAPIHPLPAEYYQTPQGYDVRHGRDAQAYLEEERRRQIILPKTEDDVFALLAGEFRAAKYLDGRNENVWEHSKHVKALSLEEAANSHPSIAEEEVETDADVHDWDEALGGDTIITDPLAESTRFLRGAANATLLYASLPKSNPYLQAYLRYRQSDLTGIWTPSGSLVKTMDKVAAYDFQLRDDVRATLHRERQEDFTDLYKVVVDKVISNSQATVRLMSVFRQLGEKWVEWGCKDIDGDPNTIVNYFTYHALRRHIARNQNHYENSGKQADVRPFGTDRQPAPPQRLIFTPEKAKEYGSNVVLLSAVRGDNQPTPPPTPPANPASGLYLVA